MTGVGIERPSGQLVHRVRKSPAATRCSSAKSPTTSCTAASRAPGWLHGQLRSWIGDRAAFLAHERDLGSHEPTRRALSRADHARVAARDALRARAARGDRDRAGRHPGRGARRGGIARCAAGEGHQYRFTHPLVQQVMSQAPSLPRRQQIHLRIAEHLQKSPGAEGHRDRPGDRLSSGSGGPARRSRPAHTLCEPRRRLRARELRLARGRRAARGRDRDRGSGARGVAARGGGAAPQGRPRLLPPLRFGALCTPLRRRGRAVADQRRYGRARAHAQRSLPARRTGWV